jgi:hypothetical protein
MKPGHAPGFFARKTDEKLALSRYNASTLRLITGADYEL